MDLVEWIRTRNDRGGPVAWLRQGVVGASQWSLPAGALHRLLGVERSLRRRASDEIARALYYQPLFELLCEEVERPFRLEICPDSKLPVVSGCRLVVRRGVRLSARTTFSGARNAPRPPRIVLGEGTYIGHRVVLRAGLDLRLGAHCFVASNVFLSGDPGHPLDPQRRRVEAAPPESLGAITLGDDVWIGEGAAVMGNLRIGDGSVVAARSVVTKDVPAGVLVAGAPARVVRRIDGKREAEEQGPEGATVSPGA